MGRIGCELRPRPPRSERARPIERPKSTGHIARRPSFRAQYVSVPVFVSGILDPQMFHHCVLSRLCHCSGSCMGVLHRLMSKTLRFPTLPFVTERSKNVVVVSDEEIVVSGEPGDWRPGGDSESAGL